MKILVFGRPLEVGGTEVNTIDLCVALRDLHGHDVVLFATPGPMLDVVKEKGIRHIPAPAAPFDAFHPSPARMRALDRVLREERPDVVYVWEWVQCLDAFPVTQLLRRVPMVQTEMSMTVMRQLPKSPATTYGTGELVDRARALGRKHVELIVPPVDVAQHNDRSIDVRAFRAKHRIPDDAVVFVTVSRLEPFLKGESLRESVEAMRRVGKDTPVYFLIVGDGALRPELEALARQVDHELQRKVIGFTGLLKDPRAAYAVADVVIGMGGSALRGMSCGKPVIVVGEKGFSAPLSPETARHFEYHGIYGLGDGTPAAERLARQIKTLADSAELRRELGDFSRRFVTEQFSIEVVSARLDRFLKEAARNPVPLHRALWDAARTAVVYVAGKLRGRFFPREGF